MMAKNIGCYSPSHPHAGKFVEKISRPVVRAAGSALKFYDNKSRYAMLKGQEMRERLSLGKSVYLVGIGPKGSDRLRSQGRHVLTAGHSVQRICR